MTAVRSRAESDIDVFSDDVADDPYPIYRMLRDQAPAVYLRRYDCWVVTRYEDVRAALGDWESFSSAHGVALLDEVNALQVGTVLAADPPKHTQLRSVLSEKLAPRAIRALRGEIEARAAELVNSVVSLGTFDAMSGLAKRLPVTIIADLIGLPEQGREKLLPGADAIFTQFGPVTPTLEQRMPLIEEYTAWMVSVTDRRHLRPGSWGAAILDAVDDGRIDPSGAMLMLGSYLVAGMDTTVNGIGAMLQVFAEHPDVWQKLREDPNLAGGVFEEALRFESPVQGFFRMATRDVEFGGHKIPSGARVLMHFGSANHDERHYADPERFDVKRNPLDHMAFGYGNHACAGQGVARMEARALLGALLERVDHFELAGTPRRHYNPVVRGLEELPLTIHLRRD